MTVEITKIIFIKNTNYGFLGKVNVSQLGNICVWDIPIDGFCIGDIIEIEKWCSGDFISWSFIKFKNNKTNWKEFGF